MSICKIYAVYPDTGKKYEMGNVLKHYDMNNWLLDKGKKEFTYELHKGEKVHSIWIWKENKERWGRTATPSNKKVTPIIVDNSEKESCDRHSRKKARKEKEKANSTRCRQRRG